MKEKITAAALTIAAMAYAGTAYPETREQCLGYTSGAIFSALTKNKCGFEIIDKKMVRQTVDKINGLVKLQMQNITPDQFCEMNHPLAHLRLQLQMMR